MRNLRKTSSFFYGVLVVIVVVTLLIISSPVSSKWVQAQNQPTAVAQQTTPTPFVTATAITEQIIQEGKPIGILIGAIGLILIVLLSALIFFPQKNGHIE